MSNPDPAKLQAANTAATLVRDGMVLGLGSGSTAALVLHTLADRVRREGLQFVGVATSEATAALARSLALPLRDLDEVAALDLVLDGADEVDPQFRMIKGRGGALLREKIVASAARRRAIVITPEKRVSRLGARAPIPVEVSPFGHTHTERHLRDLGARPRLRADAQGRPLLTDGGHPIYDCTFPEIDDPAALGDRLRRIPGVFETGLFLGLCDLLIVGHPDRTAQIERPTT